MVFTKSTWLHKRYGTYKRCNLKMFNTPEVFDEAIEDWKNYLKKNPQEYPCLFSFAEFLWCSVIALKKHKNRPWYEQSYQDLMDYLQYSLLKKWLDRWYEPRLVKLMLSHDFWVVEKTQQDVNINWWLPIWMTISEPWAWFIEERKEDEFDDDDDDNNYLETDLYVET